MFVLSFVFGKLSHPTVYADGWQAFEEACRFYRDYGEFSHYHVDVWAMKEIGDVMLPISARAVRFA